MSRSSHDTIWSFWRPPSPCGNPTHEGAQKNPGVPWAGTAGQNSATVSTHRMSCLYKHTEGEIQPVWGLREWGSQGSQPGTQIGSSLSQGWGLGGSFLFEASLGKWGILSLLCLEQSRILQIPTDSSTKAPLCPLPLICRKTEVFQATQNQERTGWSS